MNLLCITTSTATATMIITIIIIIELTHIKTIRELFLIFKLFLIKLSSELALFLLRYQSLSICSQIV